MTSTDIYDFARVSPSAFDISKLSCDKSSIEGTKRSRFLYQYTPDLLKEFHLALPLDPESYVMLEPFVKELYKGVETGKFKSSFGLDSSNDHHLLISSIFESIVEKFSKSLSVDIKFPVTVNDSGARVYVGLIQNAKGDIYTPFYTKDSQQDILQYGGALARLALSMSVNPSSGRLSIQIYQAYLHEQRKNFPLAHRE